MKLLYIANIRLPTERAHGVQIVQNCEAFADAGAEVELWIARRFNTPELRGIRDVWAHYGVKQNFSIRRLPCIDLLPLVPERADVVAKAIFSLQLLTFALAALIGAVFSRADIYFSRDPLIVLLISLIKPKHQIGYEAHLLAQGRFGKALERAVLRRAGNVFATTRHLADDLIKRGASPAHTHVAHDGVRAARFADLPSADEARDRLGYAGQTFVIGYVGRFQTLSMDKGVGMMIDAASQVDGVSVMLVGGPDDIAEGYKRQWIERGGSVERFLYPGQVPPSDVPLYLSGCDALAIPFPAVDKFAFHASPMKLFEYMAAQRTILSSDLPSIREVVDDESAVLLPPDNVTAWAEAIRRLRDDPALRARLAAKAHARVMDSYTWEARARMILDAIRVGLK